MDLPVTLADWNGFSIWISIKGHDISPKNQLYSGCLVNPCQFDLTIVTVKNDNYYLYTD